MGGDHFRPWNVMSVKQRRRYLYYPHKHLFFRPPTCSGQRSEDEWACRMSRNPWKRWKHGALYELQPQVWLRRFWSRLTGVRRKPHASCRVKQEHGRVHDERLAQCSSPILRSRKFLRTTYDLPFGRARQDRDDVSFPSNPLYLQLF